MITIVSRHGISSITPKWLAARRLAVLHNTARSATRVRPLLLLPTEHQCSSNAQGDVEACPSGHLSCSSVNIAVAGGTDSDPLSTTPDAPVANTTYYSRPGVHRFIGIGMVIALAVVAFALWVYFAKYPRRKLVGDGVLRAPGEGRRSTESGRGGRCSAQERPGRRRGAAYRARREGEGEGAELDAAGGAPGCDQGGVRRRRHVHGGAAARASPTPRPVAHRRMGIRARPRRSLRGEMRFFFW